MSPYRNPWRWLGLALFLVYIRGLFIDLMDVDAAQYASIAMEMLRGGHWLQVQYHHANYLDKPPLLFWSSALSFAAFGLHPWAYKLPSLIATMAGVYATYRFTLLYYPQSTARNAAFILAASVGAVLMSNDVRTDALLLGATACAVWQLAEHLESGRMLPLLLGALFTGLAMLAKGPIGIVMPAFAVGTHIALRRDWRALWRWQWLLGLMVVAIVLAPMCWGLYQQFGNSGLYFYFWEQSFGRITGSNAWKNDTSVFTFLHIYLWAFLPWPLLLVGALWDRMRMLVRERFHIARSDEAYSLGGFALTFIALSLSHYKLPHYIFVTLPWASILAARWLAGRSGSLARAWWIAQYVVFAVFMAVVIWLLRGVFPPGNSLVWLVAVALFGVLLIECARRPFPADPDLLVRRSIVAAVATLFVLNFHFYPNLLPYQSTILAPAVARSAGATMDRFASYNRTGAALDFYSGRTLPVLTTPAEIRDSAQPGPLWLFTDEPGRVRLDSAGVNYSEVAVLQHFEVAQLTGRFLNPATRARTLVPVFVLRVWGSPPEQP